MTKAQFWAKRPHPMFLRQMEKARKRKAEIELRAAKIRAKLARISRSVSYPRVTAVALKNQHTASSPETERSPASVTVRQGMVSPGYPPVGRSTNSPPASHSDCLANATPVNGETTHKASRTLEAALTVSFG